MSESLDRLLDCLTLLELSPEDCLGALEGSGVPLREAFELMLDRFPPKARTPGLARARYAAGVAQRRPDLFEGLAEVLQGWGIHSVSMLSWQGWEPDQALDLLQRHWRGPGRPPLCLVGIGHVQCADLRLLPSGLRIQRLKVAHSLDLRSLPSDLEIEESLQLEDLRLDQLPSVLPCGGAMVAQDALRKRLFRLGPLPWPWCT